MQGILIQFAEAEAGAEVEENLLGVLGIDWQLLILQTVSFVILVFILTKFVYPPILAMLDRHDKKIADSLKAAEEAQKNASEAEAKSNAMLEKSRTEAAEIIETAKQESTDILIRAEEDANLRAEAIIADARDDLNRDVEQARSELREEMVDLVALATEKVIDTKMAKEDKKLIKSVLEEAA